MSKKGKAILASALFGAAIFGASCGGGGGGAPTPPPPPPPPPANDIAKVLVLAQKGFTSPGALIGLFEGTVKDNGTVVWSADLNPNDNDLEYLHEFSNASVLLYDTSSGDLYLYSGGTLSAVKGGAGIGTYNDDNIYLPNFVVFNYSFFGIDLDYVVTSNGKVVDYSTIGERLIYAGENYVVIGSRTGSERVWIVKKDGTKIELDWDDKTLLIEPINVGRAWLLDRVENTDIILLGHNSGNKNALFVIDDNGDALRITNSTNVATGDDPVANIYSGKIVRDASGNIYVAVLNDPDGIVKNGDENIEYFKIIPPVASSVVYTPTTQLLVNGGANANTLSPSLYALDGAGHLYFIGEIHDGLAETKSELNQAFIDASNIFSIAPKNDSAGTDMNNYLLLAFSQGVLMSDPGFTNFFHFIYNAAQPTNVALNPDVIGAVQLCNGINTVPLIAENNPFYTKTKQEPIVGEGTDRIMCGTAYADDTFAWIEHRGSGTYNGDSTADVNNDSINFTPRIYHAIATSNSMVYVVETFPNFTKTYECPFGTDFSAGQTCIERNMSKAFFFDIYPDEYPILSARNSNYKFKTDTNVLSDGNRYIYGGFGAGVAPNINAAYFTSTISAPYLVNIQTGAVDTSTLSIPFTTAGFGARGGNVSLGLDKVAHVYSPIGAQCPPGLYDHVWYKDASHNYNNLARPQNTCLIRVLQVRNP